MIEEVSYRDDGDALLARNAALEAENEKLRAENAALKAPEPALVRTTPKSIDVPREPWWKKGFAVLVWVVAIVVAVWQGVL